MQKRVLVAILIVAVIVLSSNLETRPALRNEFASTTLKTEVHQSRNSSNVSVIDKDYDYNQNIIRIQNDTNATRQDKKKEKLETLHNVNTSSIISEETRPLPNSTNKNNATYATTAHAYELQTIINKYTWENDDPSSKEGRRWIPPTGVPRFVPKQIRQIFRNENTAFLGDSTARQDFHTLYHLMNTSDSDETKNTLEFIDFPFPVNRGFKCVLPDEFYCPARQQPLIGETWVELAQVKGTDGNCSANTTANTLAFGRGKFDYKILECYTKMLAFITNFRDFFQKEYSLLVISAGIWQVMRPKDCLPEGAETDSGFSFTGILVEVLEALQEYSGPSSFVVFKSFGPSARQNRGLNNTAYVELNGVARDWFAEKQPRYMDLVDFDRAIEERKWGKARIKGDLHSHFGVEARLMTINMLSDVVFRKQSREESLEQG